MTKTLIDDVTPSLSKDLQFPHELYSNSNDLRRTPPAW